MESFFVCNLSTNELFVWKTHKKIVLKCEEFCRKNDYTFILHMRIKGILWKNVDK